jgi:hypothetical protein
MEASREGTPTRLPGSPESKYPDSAKLTSPRQPAVVSVLLSPACDVDLINRARWIDMSSERVCGGVRRQLDDVDELLLQPIRLTSARRRFSAASGFWSRSRLDRHVGRCLGFERTESDGGG